MCEPNFHGFFLAFFGVVERMHKYSKCRKVITLKC